MSFYSDEQDERVQFRYRRRDSSPPPVNYVPARSDRPRSRVFFPPGGVDSMLAPERTMTIARVRERSRERRSSPPPTPTIVLPPQQPPPPPQTPQQQQAPVVIRQSFHDRPSSDDESSVDSRRRGGRSRGRGRSHSHVSRRSSPSRSRSRSDSGTYMTVRDYEIERKLDENRRQLEALRMAPSPHPDAEQYELTRARRELEELRAKDERDAQLEAQRSGEEERWESRMSNYELARTRRDLEELRAKDEREAQLEAQRAGEEERWETRRSKYELEDLRAREAREAREKSEAARRAADFENFELLQSKKELEALKAQQQREKDAMEKIHEARTQMELMSAKEELDRIKQTEEKAKEERRIRREIELKQLEEQRRAEEEQRAREQADADAVERWKAREAEKAAKEQREKERTDREVRLRLREHLAATGMPEDQIQAILDKKKFDQNHGAAGSAQASQPSSPAPQQWAGGQVSNGMELAPPKTTYTRMARRHLSLETLRARGIDYDIDLQNPEYVVVKRWVPPEEQQELWSLTKVIREGREREQVTTTLSIEDRRHHHHHRRHKSSSGDNLVVVKKTKRERSRSPGVSTLMYLAGAR